MYHLRKKITEICALISLCFTPHGAWILNAPQHQCSISGCNTLGNTLWNFLESTFEDFISYLILVVSSPRESAGLAYWLKGSVRLKQYA